MFYVRTQASMELCTATDRLRCGKAYISSSYVYSCLSVFQSYYFHFSLLLSSFLDFHIYGFIFHTYLFLSFLLQYFCVLFSVSSNEHRSEVVIFSASCTEF